MTVAKGPAPVALGDVIPDVPDPAVWSCALARSPSGDVSLAVSPSNSPCEDQSQVAATPFGTYAAVYDGHGGPQASAFLNKHLLRFMEDRLAKEGPTAGAFQEALLSAEQHFLDEVRAGWQQRPQLAAAGACVLLALLSSQGQGQSQGQGKEQAEGQEQGEGRQKDSTLHVVSLGDSTAVLGRQRSLFLGGGVAPEVLSGDHNANNPVERQEVQARFPMDKGIVVNRMGVWRVKGIIQVTRSIGDFYLKHQEFQRPPLNPRFLLPTPLAAPALLTEPTIVSCPIGKHDKFVILASDGLWDHVKPGEACSIVAKFSRVGIARRLARLALHRCCKAQGLKVSQLPLRDPARSRQVHDDISVIVLFFNHCRSTWSKASTGAAVRRATSDAAAVITATPSKDGVHYPSDRLEQGLAVQGECGFSPHQLENQISKEYITGAPFL